MAPRQEETCGGLLPLIYYFVAVGSFTYTIIAVTTDPNKTPADQFHSFSDLRLRCLDQEKSEREELINAVKFLTFEKVKNRQRREEEMKSLGITAIIFSVAMLIMFNMSSVSCSGMDQRNSRLASHGHRLMMERFRKVRDEALEEVRKEMGGEAREPKEEQENEATPATQRKEHDLDQNHESNHLGDHLGDHDHPVLKIANSVVYINTNSAPPSPRRGPSEGQHQLHHSW